MLKIGDLVRKKQGFPFWGTLVSIFKTHAGLDRVVVDFMNMGMLHIYSLDHIEKIEDEDCINDFEEAKKSINKLKK